MHYVGNIETTSPQKVLKVIYEWGDGGHPDERILRSWHQASTALYIPVHMTHLQWSFRIKSCGLENKSFSETERPEEKKT